MMNFIYKHVVDFQLIALISICYLQQLKLLSLQISLSSNVFFLNNFSKYYIR